MKHNKITIGVQYLDAYPEKRNIVNIIPDAQYVYVEDWYRKLINAKVKLRSYTKLKRSLGSIIAQKDSERYSFYLPSVKEDVNFFHFFNTINLRAKQPWGVTFEATLPHFPPFSDFHKGDFENGNTTALKKIKRYLDALADDQCKFIIAISDCNYKIQEGILKYFPDYKEKIEEKLHLLHPSQKVIINDFSEKVSYEDKVNFMFVGSDFLGKGGGEIIKVFKKIKKRYHNFHLYLVGNFDLNSNNAADFTKEDVLDFQNFISENKSLVTYFPSMENKKILKLLKEKIHVGLLPTRSDTYGYSVLEFQSAGCPTISVDLRALPEINKEDLGWLIPVKTNKFGESFHFNKKQLKDMAGDIEIGLEKHIASILEKPGQIDEKRNNALKRIQKEHCIENYRNKLMNIYMSSLKDSVIVDENSLAF